MTASTDTPSTPPSSGNGRRPDPAAEDCAPCAEALLHIPTGAAIGERALGLLGFGVGLVLALMGMDLLLGGVLSRAVGFGSVDDGNRGAS
jgi:hypothetical protein